MTLIPSGLANEPINVIFAPLLNKPIGGTVITSMTSAKGLADGSPAGIPAGARIAQVTPGSNASGGIRFRRRGAPTSTFGTPLEETTLFEGSLDTIRFIDTTNGGGGVLQVEFFA